MEILDMTNREKLEDILNPMLETLSRAISLEKIGLKETAIFVLHDNVTICGKE